MCVVAIVCVQGYSIFTTLIQNPNRLKSLINYQTIWIFSEKNARNVSCFVLTAMEKNTKNFGKFSHVKNTSFGDKRYTIYARQTSIVAR